MRLLLTSDSTYLLISKILSQTYPASELLCEFDDSKMAWDQLVIIGSKHLVLPAIYSNLEKKGLAERLPPDLEAYLKEIYTINKNRNSSILSQTEELTELFKEHSINYVLLKGVALLTSIYSKDLGFRMIGDIDILIDRTQSLKAFDLLKSVGYTEGKSFDYDVKDFRHLTRLVHSKKIAAVELHTDLLNPKYRCSLKAEDVFKNTQLINNMVLPSNDLMTLHAIYGYQLNDKGHYYFQFNLKIIVDTIHLNISQNSQLLNNLMNHPYGCSFLAYGHSIFDDFKAIDKNRKIVHYLNRIHLYQRFPALDTLQKFIKLNIEKVLVRIKLLLTNSSYRYHLLKNKIFPRFN